MSPTCHRVLEYVSPTLVCVGVVLSVVLLAPSPTPPPVVRMVR